MQYAAAYVRVSTDDQVEYSPDAQLRAIKSYCEKNDYFLDPAYIFVDEGYSGRKAEKRPAFMRMIGVAKRKPAPFQAILVHKFDRFARSREDSVVYKSLLRKECGVAVISITETIENDKMSLIMESMLEAMAEYYSINLGEEVKKGMTEKARRGEPCSIPPFGYKMVEKQLVPVPEEADAVRRIFSDFMEGKAYFAIAHDCNAAGLRTHRGGLFENRTIEYIIRNPVYAGYVRWTPTKKIRRNFSDPESMVVKGSHDAIISMPDFEAAQRRVEELKAIWRPYYKPQRNKSHWLVGLLRAPCGSSMVNSNGYFICSDYAHGKCRDRNSIAVDKLEARILRQIEADLIDSSSMTILYLNESAHREEVETRLADLEMRMQRTKDAYERGIDTIDEYSFNKSRIVKEMDEERAKLKPVPAEHCPENILTAMQEIICNPQQRVNNARKIIKQIVWDKSSQSIDITYFTE